MPFCLAPDTEMSTDPSRESRTQIPPTYSTSSHEQKCCEPAVGRGGLQAETATRTRLHEEQLDGPQRYVSRKIMRGGLAHHQKKLKCVDEPILYQVRLRLSFRVQHQSTSPSDYFPFFHLAAPLAFHASFEGFLAAWQGAHSLLSVGLLPSLLPPVARQANWARTHGTNVSMRCSVSCLLS